MAPVADGCKRMLRGRRTRGEGCKDLVLMLKWDRQMRVRGVESGAAIRERTREIPAAGYGHVAIPFAVPEEHGDVNGSKVEAPWPRDQRNVRNGTTRPRATSLHEARHEAVCDFRSSQEASIGFGCPRGHSLPAAFSTTADRAQLQPKQATEQRRGRSGETKHHPQRATHRSLVPRSIGRRDTTD